MAHKCGCEVVDVVFERWWREWQRRQGVSRMTQMASEGDISARDRASAPESQPKAIDALNRTPEAKECASESWADAHIRADRDWKGDR